MRHVTSFKLENSQCNGPGQALKVPILTLREVLSASRNQKRFISKGKEAI